MQHVNKRYPTTDGIRCVQLLSWYFLVPQRLTAQFSHQIPHQIFQIFRIFFKLFFLFISPHENSYKMWSFPDWKVWLKINAREPGATSKTYCPLQVPSMCFFVYLVVSLLQLVLEILFLEFTEYKSKRKIKVSDISLKIVNKNLKVMIKWTIPI